MLYPTFFSSSSKCIPSSFIFRGKKPYKLVYFFHPVVKFSVELPIIQIFKTLKGLRPNTAKLFIIYCHNISLAWGKKYLPTWLLSQPEPEGIFYVLVIFDILKQKVSIHDSIHLCMYPYSEAQIMRYTWRSFWWNIGFLIVHVYKWPWHALEIMHRWTFLHFLELMTSRPGLFY